jgi:rSAM/selenodomain-associated transferase 1
MKKQKSVNLLCIMSRFPEEGRCKTRLIPAIGAGGAAFLQRRMSEHIIEVGRQTDCDVLLLIDGGTDVEIQTWLGGKVDFLRQQGDGLGERMIHGFHTGFVKEYEKIILIGADCPSLTSSILQQGFRNLKDSDLVLGPSVDGGYYLVGMNQPHPEILSGIDWGTDQVLAQTMARACELQTSRLPVLSDVDSAEDLHKLPAFLQTGLLF